MSDEKEKKIVVGLGNKKPQARPAKFMGKPSNVGFNKGAALRKGQNRRGV